MLRLKASWYENSEGMDAIQEGLRAHRPTVAAVWIVRLGER
jgi:hypothetical protein